VLVARRRPASTQAAFHALLDGLSEDDLRRPSGNPTWTVGGVLSHLVWSLELLPREVASARKGKGMFNFPPLVRDWLNAQLTRLGARGQTLQTLRRRYDAAFAAALATLDGVSDDEFQLGARF
jgi:Mycothiol maleylpyruvate isomerase N-terminal domain